MITGNGCWEPECWSESPEQLQAEAQAENEACFAHAAANAKKHSNPPCQPSSLRPF